MGFCQNHVNHVNHVCLFEEKVKGFKGLCHILPALSQPCHVPVHPSPCGAPSPRVILLGYVPTPKKMARQIYPGDNGIGGSIPICSAGYPVSQGDGSAGCCHVVYFLPSSRWFQGEMHGRQSRQKCQTFGHSCQEAHRYGRPGCIWASCS